MIGPNFPVKEKPSVAKEPAKEEIKTNAKKRRNEHNEFYRKTPPDTSPPLRTAQTNILTPIINPNAPEMPKLKTIKEIKTFLTKNPNAAVVVGSDQNNEIHIFSKLMNKKYKGLPLAFVDLGSHSETMAPSAKKEIFEFMGIHFHPILLVYKSGKRTATLRLHNHTRPQTYAKQINENFLDYNRSEGEKLLDATKKGLKFSVASREYAVLYTHLENKLAKAPNYFTKNSMIFDKNGKLKLPLNQGTAVIDFSATWCAPCGTLYPFFQSLALTNTSVNFATFTTDFLPENSLEKITEAITKNYGFGFDQIPTFALFKNGHFIKKITSDDFPKGTIFKIESTKEPEDTNVNSHLILEKFGQFLK